MGFRLGDRVAYAVNGGRTIFMDVRRGRYLGVSWTCDQAFQHLMRRGDLPADQIALLGPLVRKGLLTTSDAETSILEPLPSTAAREWKPRHKRASGGLVAQCIVAQLKASVVVARGDLAFLIDLVGRWRRRRTTRNREDIARLDSVVLAFDTIRPFRIRSNQCLADAIAFFDVASQQGLDVRLVFGVTSAPFAAHCWIQHGDSILNDRLETIRRFSPILEL